ncbi:M28 family metallopeptidase [Deinococcus aquaticus]|uniref:M28 family metallopeptidase n=1 Tax=Deinococcus aquaticus TaxID=328692 RepID=A0ABY7UZF6_9DEIO|nr:M28 family metallopeptidase [Deinococcus aquaticus]WDA58292.1 M28 family metallopeptidase [Deinococcus aquaticus]
MPRPLHPLPTRPPVPAWKVLLPVLLAGGVGWGAWHAASRPVNPPAQAGAQRISAAQDWEALMRFGPRQTGSEGLSRSLDWAQAQFEALGYRVTRQALPDRVPMPVQREAAVQVSGPGGPQTLNGEALLGVQTAEQTGTLVRLPPGVTDEQLDGLLGKLAVTTCPDGPWRDLTDRALNAGLLGLVIVNDCPRPPAYSPLGNVALPVLSVTPGVGRALLAQVGREVTFITTVRTQDTPAWNLIAARVDAAPEVLFGAHLDSVPGSPGANDNASGVLAVLNAARQAAGTPLAGRAWFVLFSAEEQGLLGSRAFVRAHAYPLRHTRAMLNFDMVGVNAAPLGIDAHPDLLTLARRVRPDLRAFRDAPTTSRETFGRSSSITGRSDYLPFKQVGVRTAFLYRGEDPHYHRPTDTTLNPALAVDAADLGAQLAQAALDAPWTPREPCGITGRNCQ